jgi:hypothetical protein
MVSGVAADINCIVFNLNWLWLKPRIYHTQSGSNPGSTILKVAQTQDLPHSKWLKPRIYHTQSGLNPGSTTLKVSILAITPWCSYKELHNWQNCLILPRTTTLTSADTVPLSLVTVMVYFPVSPLSALSTWSLASLSELVQLAYQ